MDRFDENATGSSHDKMPLYLAAYFNNMSNRELYGWIMFERRGDVPVEDPKNLSDEFKARAIAINIDRLPPGDPTTWVLPNDTYDLKRLKAVVREQIDCWNRLIKEGCTPWFDRSQIQHVVYNPKALPSITELWRGRYDDGSRVLSKQLLIWRTFRFWQSWRRRDKINISILEKESLKRLAEHGLGNYFYLFKLDQDKSVQTEATKLLEYLHFIDQYYGSSHARVESCQKALDKNCVCEQDFSLKRDRRLTKMRKRRATGTSKGRATGTSKGRATGTSKGRACVGKCKEGAVANLENEKRTLELRNAIWGRTVSQLNRLHEHECRPNDVESVYPASPLETKIQIEDAGPAVLSTRPAQDLDVYIVDYRPRKQGAERGRPMGSRSYEGQHIPWVICDAVPEIL